MFKDLEGFQRFKKLQVVQNDCIIGEGQFGLFFVGFCIFWYNLDFIFKVLRSNCRVLIKVMIYLDLYLGRIFLLQWVDGVEGDWMGVKKITVQVRGRILMR